MTEMDAQWVCEWLADQNAAMQDALMTLVNLESNSYDPDGITLVRNQLAEWLLAGGVRAETIETPDGLPALTATVGPSATTDNPAIFLTGHMDTVFPRGTASQRPGRIEGTQAFGPGVADMKAGLVMNVFVMLALQSAVDHRALALPHPVSLLFTPDEEIGSLQGRILIRQRIAGALAVFNAEPGRMSGNVVTARKGGDSFVIDVHGRSAHAGVNHAQGVSAIEALARIIPRIHALTNYEAGITTNIGLIQGGQSSNTVADQATAKLDVRFVRMDQRKAIHQQLQRCITEHGVNGATASLHHVAGFLPFEESMSRDLLPFYQQQAQKVGFDVSGEFTGGCSDAGWTAALGVPTLCATGPIGGWPHTDREYCDLTSQVPRAQALARTLLFFP